MIFWLKSQEIKWEETKFVVQCLENSIEWAKEIKFSFLSKIYILKPTIKTKINQGRPTKIRELIGIIWEKLDQILNPSVD